MNKKCIYCFKNLGIDSRAKIYMHISLNGSKNVTELTSLVNLKQPTVSYHLNEMVKTGLLNKEKRGKEVIFSVNQNCPHSNYELECVVNN